jgi:hypothetical protein
LAAEEIETARLEVEKHPALRAARDPEGSLDRAKGILQRDLRGSPRKRRSWTMSRGRAARRRKTKKEIAEANPSSATILCGEGRNPS